MGTFSKIKKYSKPSHEINEKIESLDLELKKTIGEAVTNSTTGVYNTFQYVDSVAEVPPTYDNVPDTSGITGNNFVQPTGGGNVNNPATWDTGWQDTSYLYNSNELDGETGRPIVKSVPNPPGAGVPAGGGGIVVTASYFGTSVGYIKNGNEYEQVLVGGLLGGTENPGEPNNRRDYYRFLSDEEFDYAVSFWNAYQESLYIIPGTNQESINTVSIKAWREYNRFHDFQRGGEWETWTYGPKKLSNGRKMILFDFGLVTDPNKYQSDPGSPYQSAFTQLLNRYGLGDPNYYPGPIESNIGDKWGLSPQAYSELIAGTYDLIKSGQVPYMKPEKAKQILSNPKYQKLWDDDPDALKAVQRLAGA